VADSADQAITRPVTARRRVVDGPRRVGLSGQPCVVIVFRTVTWP
jgi:hypothetical protein